MSEPGNTLSYSSKDLDEFGYIITSKMARAEEALRDARESLILGSTNDTADTDFARHEMEDGQPALEREELMRTVSGEGKFILELQHALSRIRTGTYGVCRATGLLIPKERLRVVPHATLSMVGKQLQLVK